MKQLWKGGSDGKTTGLPRSRHYFLYHQSNSCYINGNTETQKKNKASMCTYFRHGVGMGGSLEDASISSINSVVLCDLAPSIPSLFSLYDCDFISLASPFPSFKEYSVISAPTIPWAPNWKHNQWQLLKLCRKDRIWAMWDVLKWWKQSWNTTSPQRPQE